MSRIIFDPLGNETTITPTRALIELTNQVCTELPEAEFHLICTDDELRFIPSHLPTNLRVHPTATSWFTPTNSSNARHNKTASMRIGLDMVRPDQGDVLVTAGHTPALIQTTLSHRIPGIRRPAYATVAPYWDRFLGKLGQFVLVELGQTTGETPDELVGFAHLGSCFAQQLGLEDRGVCVIGMSNQPVSGLEEEQLRVFTERIPEFLGFREAHRLFFPQPGETLPGVVVCDGRTGNIVTKTAVGCMDAFLAFSRSVSSCSSPILSDLCEEFLRFRGALCLGLRSNILKVRQDADLIEYRGALRTAVRIARLNVPGCIATTNC